MEIVNTVVTTNLTNGLATAYGLGARGGGLYLNVTSTGTKSWLFMWTPRGGKRKEMGLGSYPTVTLAKARSRAAECRVDIDGAATRCRCAAV